MDNHNSGNSGKGLTPEKKEELKQMMGKFSGKASLSLLAEFERYDLLDTYESFIDERCFYCGEELTSTEDIFVDVISDRYICEDCGKYHNIKVVKCIDFY